MWKNPPKCFGGFFYYVEYLIVSGVTNLMIILNVLDSRVKMGPEVVAVIFAQYDLVGRVAFAFQYLAVYPCLECRGVDIVVHRFTIAKGAAIVEVDARCGLQRSSGTEGAFADGVARGQHLLDDGGLDLAHADGIQVAEDDVWDVLGGEVAAVLALWVNIIRCPSGVLISSWALFVAGLHHLGALVDERTYEIVEVVLVAA